MDGSPDQNTLAGIPGPAPALGAPEATYRRRRVAGLLAVLGLLTIVVNGSQWLEHRRLRERLAGELGAHLVAIAEVTAAAVDGDMLRRWQDWGMDEDESDQLLDYLREVRRASSLSNLFLLDPDDPEGRSLLDVTGVVAAGEVNPVLALDRQALVLAASGTPAATRLYATPGGGAYLKTGYAPVTADDGTVTGILGVEGSSALFAVLDEVRHTLIALTVASILGVIALGAVLVRISESLARAERDLLRAEALTTMGRMAASIAHEIRNPLGIIRATAERLKRRYAAPGAGDPLFDSIPEEVDRLNGILTGYLNFAADRRIELRPLDLVPLIRGTLELAAAELERAGIEVETSSELESAPVLGDDGRMRQVLLNLILNAKQAMPHGGRLALALARSPAPADRALQAGIPSGSGSGYRIAVTDNGVGIPRRRLSEVWKPFFTSRADGSGLGLAVVRRIIDEHQGSVGIESEEGHGTTVTVILPAILPVAAPHRAGNPGGPGGRQGTASIRPEGGQR